MTTNRRIAAALFAALLLMSPAARAADGPGAAAYATMLRAWADGDLDAALKAADAVRKAEPRNVTYLNAIGGLYCEKAQKANPLTKMSWAGKCRSTWEGALTIDPTHIDVRLSLLQYYSGAPGIAGGGMDKARAQAKEIAALDGVRGEIAWGVLARIEKKLDEAERHYRKAADLDTAGIRGPAALATFYAGQKRWAEARGLFEGRLAKDPGDRFAAYQLARLIQAEGTELARALPLLDRYLEGPEAPGLPSHADAWYRKGQIAARLGKKAEAIASLETALKLVPDHMGATRELKKLKS